MALIECNECRKEVSDKAAACTHCGAPIIKQVAKGKEPVKGFVALAWVGALIVVMLLVQAVFKNSDSDDAPTAEPSTSSSTSNIAESSQPMKLSAATLKTWMDVLESNAGSAALRLNYAESVVKNFPESPEAAKAAAMLPKLRSDADDEKTNGKWSYSSSQDSMSNGQVKMAVVHSDNAISLDSPYEGLQNGTLVIQNHPRQGRSVFVMIEKGQIMCSSYDCSIRVRFDDGKASTYQGTEPSDNSTETVFLPDALLRKIEQSKRVRIEMNVYHNGVQVLDFNIKGFEPESLKS